MNSKCYVEKHKNVSVLSIKTNICAMHNFWTFYNLEFCIYKGRVLEYWIYFESS